VLDSTTRSGLASGKRATWYPTSLVHHYRLDTDTGATEPDAVGSDTLTVTGATYTADAPTLTDLPPLTVISQYLPTALQIGRRKPWQRW
jgi:hypothetical protein